MLQFNERGRLLLRLGGSTGRTRTSRGTRGTGRRCIVVFGGTGVLVTGCVVDVLCWWTPILRSRGCRPSVVVCEMASGLVREIWRLSSDLAGQIGSLSGVLVTHMGLPSNLASQMRGQVRRLSRHLVG